MNDSYKKMPLAVISINDSQNEWISDKVFLRRSIFFTERCPMELNQWVDELFEVFDEDKGRV